MIIPGAAGSPVILHVPHASTVIPDNVRAGILLDDNRLAAELAAMTDAHTDTIALAAADRVTPRPWAYVNPYSRLVVDPERFPSDAEEMNQSGWARCTPTPPTSACSVTSPRTPPSS